MTLDPEFRVGLSRFLPADLLAQLPDPQALATAIRRLNSLHQALASFLPQYIADNETFYTQDYGALRPGVFMFSDVSGFTALSEKLQRRSGKEGAETLTEIINQFFATMLEILAKSNGQLLKFAGDALLTFFPASDTEDVTPLAIRTGLRMQRAMKSDFQPIKNARLDEMFGSHDLELTMSIGICRGKLFEAVVGNYTQRDHVIQGDLPGQAMRAEEAGDRDDVIIAADLQAEYAGMFDTEPVSEGFYRVLDNFGGELDDYEFVVPRRRRAQTTALFDFAEDYLLDDLERQYERVNGVSRFVAHEVVDKLAFRGDHIESENRPATVIFAYFSGFADLLEDWGEERLPLITSILDRYYTIVQRTITANGGSLTRSDPYRRGVKLLITFGAPVAHPDDPERAVTTALEMNRQLAEFNLRLRDEVEAGLRRDTFLTQRIGITHGPVFAGEVGWRARREYTVMGDDVNLAARLMGNGDMGQILVSVPVWDRVNPHFETEALEPLRLKGKSQPVQVYAVKASTISPLTMSPTSDTPFVGHDLQMLALTYGLQQAKGPRRRQAFALQGNAGVGKTRIAKQIGAEAEKAGFTVAWANCQLGHGRDQSVWAALLYQLFQLDRAKSEQAQRRLLSARLGELGLSDLGSIFGPLLFGTAGGSDVEMQDDLPSAVREPEAADAAKHTPNIFELADTKTDIRRSGIFGAISRQLAQVEAGSEDRPLWQAVRKKTSLPACIVRFLQALTEQTPVLLVIDDLHRADVPTLTILKRVMAEITKAKLVILVAYQPEEESSLDLGIRRKVTITDLDEDEAARMAAHVLGASHLGPRLGRLLWDRTSGRPLFIESLLNLLLSDGAIQVKGAEAELTGDVKPDALPDNVRELIVSQLDRLSAEARAVLQAASVLGDTFTVGALLVVGGFDNEIRLETLLGELLFARVIDMRPDGAYRFLHGVTQATVYESLNRMQRQKLHRAAAEFWKQQDASDRSVLSIVYHLVKGGMPMRGIELVVSAADEAERNGQIDRAIELYTHALDILPHDDSLRAQVERLQKMQE